MKNQELYNLCKQITEYKTITEKLDFLESKKEVIFKLLKEKKINLLYDIIPEECLDKFEGTYKNIEFQYWMLKKAAKDYFEYSIKPYWDTIHSKGLLKLELDKIKDIEQEERDKYIKNRLDYDKKKTNRNNYIYENTIKRLRIIDDYYKSHLWEMDNKEIIFYAKHKHFTEYLENKINPNKLIGFNTKLNEEQINKIYNKVTKDKILECAKNDFIALCKAKELSKPIKWKLEHNRKANKTALYTFVKIILLQLNYEDKFLNKLLYKINDLFSFKSGGIFKKGYTRPKPDKQKSSYLNHFRGLIFKIDDPK